MITVSGSKSLAHTTLVSQGLRAHPAPSDHWDEGNAATVLWSVIQAGEFCETDVAGPADLALSG